MPDYKELIERLHWTAKNDEFVFDAETATLAATAIETLLSQLRWAEGKRDAATKRIIQLEQELAHSDEGLGIYESRIAQLENEKEDMWKELDRVKAERDAFENAEKQGRLAVLPCKVGDTVYSTLDDLGHSYKCEVTGVYLSRREHESYVELDPISYRGSKYGASFGAFGKTVFLTREEAEAALAGEGGKDG